MIPFIQAMIGDMVGMATVVAVLAGLFKLFQISASLTEIRDLLAEIKRNTSDYSSLSSLSRPQLSGPLVREVETASEADAIIRAAALEPEP